jgi:hypothetical protein
LRKRDLGWLGVDELGELLFDCGLLGAAGPATRRPDVVEIGRRAFESIADVLSHRLRGADADGMIRRRVDERFVLHPREESSRRAVDGGGCGGSGARLETEPRRGSNGSGAGKKLAAIHIMTSYGNIEEG